MKNFQKLTTFQLESLKSAVSSTTNVGIDVIGSSSPASLLNGLASNGLNTTSHINDLEDELKVLRGQNRKLKVNFFFGNFHRYFRLCQHTHGQVADRYQ